MQDSETETKTQEMQSCNDPEIVKVSNVTRCGICQAPADRLKTGVLACQAVPGHMADGVVGIWSDLTR